MQRGNLIRTRCVRVFYECAANDEILTLIYTRTICTHLSRKAIPVAKEADSYLHIVSVRNFHFYGVDKFYPAFKQAAIYRSTWRLNIRTTK